MRAFLGVAALCFGVSGIAAASAQSLSEAAGGGLVIRTLKGDRVLAPQAEPAKATETVDTAEEAQSAFAKADVIAPVEAEEMPTEAAEVATADAEAGTVHRIPLEEFCDMIVSSARANDLPIVFFTNLIWQESRFNPNSVSRAGAQGVAQFMPETAAANGLDNPFNPFQALPASARLLRQLHEQFGNVGLAAAAYNAGPGRVMKWLSKHASLPRETRAYVATITGRPAEQWRGMDAKIAFRPARDLPCSQTPAFAELQAAQPQPESEPAPAEVSKPLTVKTFAARSRPAKRGRRALHGTVKIASKPVQLTIIAPEPGRSTVRHAKAHTPARDKKGKQKHVRLASTTP
jgi:hypothetical protein